MLSSLTLRNMSSLSRIPPFVLRLQPPLKQEWGFLYLSSDKKESSIARALLRFSSLPRLRL